jgi:phosphopantothenoylcysteine decarboxylase/phosphopantothenate--cysteine ligase
MKILLVITGSVAAYRSIDLIRSLELKGNKVTVIITKGAEAFITPLSIKSLCQDMSYQDAMFQEEHEPMLHINLARAHDLILVAPASANFIAKMAAGLADSLSLSCILAAKLPIVVAPAMNPTMYSNPATQDNLHRLISRGIRVIEPQFGLVACGEEGIGKYADEETIISFLEYNHQTTKALKGKKAIVTLGATHEPIDPVRYIGNYSSGTQGLLIASELARHGCEVQILAGFTTVALPPNTIRAYSAYQMFAASLTALPADLYIGVAAIADFRPKAYSNKKIKKSNKPITLELEPTPDVITMVANHKPRPALVAGFALETDNHQLNAKTKLKNKNLDIIVSNHATHLGQPTNEFAIHTTDSSEELGTLYKEDLSIKLVATIIKRLKLFSSTI